LITTTMTYSTLLRSPASGWSTICIRSLWVVNVHFLIMRYRLLLLVVYERTLF
jgi:hypothetical protein